MIILTDDMDIDDFANLSGDRRPRRPMKLYLRMTKKKQLDQNSCWNFGNWYR